VEVAVSDAKAQLTELVRRAEAGEDIVLTRHGRPVARIVPERRRLTAAERMAAIERISTAAAKEASPGPSAARSQDWLYDDETGLPR
jgi:prevent-host-death family protein